MERFQPENVLGEGKCEVFIFSGITNLKSYSMWFTKLYSYKVPIVKNIYLSADVIIQLYLSNLI